MSRAPTRIVIAGGGVAGLEALLALHGRLDGGGLMELTLVAPAEEFSYRPLAAAAPFSGEPIPTLPLHDIAREHGAAFVRDAVVAVDPGAQVATLAGGSAVPYDVLLLATGAVPQPVAPSAIPLSGPADVPALSALVERVRSGEARRVAFAVAPGVGWTLPLYEVALQLGMERAPDGARPRLVLVTAEEEPLAAFGLDVAMEVLELLQGHGVDVYTASTVEAFEDGVLWIEFEGGVDVDALIALPQLHGPAIAGLPHDDDGFVPIDRVARVAGVEHVYAAGDACAFRLKQGGLAAQEADVAAAHIAWTLGAGPQPAPLDLVLRGELLTGAAPHFLRTRIARGGEEHDPGQASREPLWWPPAKIAARELGPYLATRLAHAAP
ncbi:MAG TPA: FAD-dependent oxidoreductase [Conexibacter sp.]|nr:FAD-dependent oxidoreductase [Conexibacter sp.]